MPGFQLVRQTARCLRHNLKTPCHGIEAQIVIQERLIAHTRYEGFGLGDMTVNVVAGRKVSNPRGYDIDRPLKQSGDVFLDPDILIDADWRVRVDLDHDIRVAVGPVVAACALAKQRRVHHATRTQGGLVLS
jgi:hypothetical protein